MARRPDASTSARWLAGVVVAVLAIATIVLAVVALDHVRATTPVDTPAPAPTFTFGAQSSPTPTPTPTPAVSYPRAAERYLSVGSGGMWRGVAGACGGDAPLIERSADGGRTWQDVTPNYLGIAHVASLASFAGTEAETIAAVGASCEAQALRTFTRGRFWEPYPDVLAASRFLDPADPARVVVPGGALDAPCADPRSFRAAGEIVALVCDGTPYVLGDGDAWTPLPATGAVALDVAGDQVLLATVSDECRGVQVSAHAGDGFADAVTRGCVEADAAAPLALTRDGDGVLVWAGDVVTRVP